MLLHEYLDGTVITHAKITNLEQHTSAEVVQESYTANTVMSSVCTEAAAGVLTR